MNFRRQSEQPDAQTPIVPKPSAVARCNFCQWSIEFRGFDAVEAATFLRGKLIEHVETMHQGETAGKNAVTAFIVGDVANAPIKTS